MRCERGNRCNRCRKLAYKLAARQYEEARADFLERYAVDKEGYGGIILDGVPFRAVEHLMRLRLEVGRAYRRWKWKSA